MISKDQLIQYKHEITWLENKIEKLATQLIRKPSKQTEINCLRRQIKETELRITFK